MQSLARSAQPCSRGEDLSIVVERSKPLDFRTKHLSTAEKTALLKEVKRRLGDDYDVILEDEGGVNEHLHIEFDAD